MVMFTSVSRKTMLIRSTDAAAADHDLAEPDLWSAAARVEAHRHVLLVPLAVGLRCPRIEVLLVHGAVHLDLAIPGSRLPDALDLADQTVRGKPFRGIAVDPRDRRRPR